MEELSIEEKAKAYDKALRKAKEYWETDNDNTLDVKVRRTMEYLFPELKESEDERIKKELIAIFKGQIPYTSKEDAERYIAWLKKQGDKLQKTSIWKHWKDGIAGNGEGEPIYLVKNGNTYSLNSCLGYECDYIELSELDKLMLEKQGEQKPVIDIDILFGAKDSELIEASYYIPEGFHAEIEGNNVVIKKGEQKPFDYENANIQQKDFAPKVEPKFNIGDWIVNNEYYNIVKVLEVNEQQYKLDYGGLIGTMAVKLIDNEYHLWTIKDAKNGDVLASNKSIFIFQEEYIAEKPTAYCGLMNGLFIRCSGGCWTNEKCRPATKEQRDLLFQKMKESGYEWNAERKELKKISQRIVSAEAKEAMYGKPACSEEDEIGLGDALWCCKQAASIAKDENDMGNVWFAEQWLKSLKSRLR